MPKKIEELEKQKKQLFTEMHNSGQIIAEYIESFATQRHDLNNAILFIEQELLRYKSMSRDVKSSLEAITQIIKFLESQLLSYQVRLQHISDLIYEKLGPIEEMAEKRTEKLRALNKQIRTLQMETSNIIPISSNSNSSAAKAISESRMASPVFANKSQPLDQISQDVCEEIFILDL